MDAAKASAPPGTDSRTTPSQRAALNQRAAQQAAVAALSRAALAETSIDALMERVVCCVADTLRTEFAKVLEVTPNEGELLLRAGVGWTPGLVGRATVPAGRGSQAGFTLLEDQPVVVADFRTETRFNAPPLLADHGVVSGMSCAIRRIDGGPYGVLGTHTRSPRQFSDNDVDFLRSVANVLAAAIGRLQLEDVLRKAEARLAGEVGSLARLNELSSRLWQMRGLNEGLEEMLHATVALLGADKGNIHLLEGGVLRLVAQQGFDRDCLEYFREVTADDSACARALRSGGPVVIDDVNTDQSSAALRTVARKAGDRAVLATPLIARDGGTLGIVSVHFQSPHRTNDQDLQRLTLYVRQAADFIERCRGERVLRESEQRYRGVSEQLRLVTDTMAAPVTLCSRDLRYVWVSTTYAAWLGRAPHEIVGRSIIDILGEHAFEKLLPFFKTVLSGQQVRYEEEVEFMGVGRRWVSATYVPTFGAAGEPDGWVAVDLDIDERRRLEQALRESEARLVSLFDALPLGVGVIDAEGKLVVSNREMDRYMPNRMIPSRDDTISWRWRATHADGRRVEPSDYPGARALRGERVVPGVEFRYTREDDGEIWIQFAAVPLRTPNGGVAGEVIVISDIDAAKRAEQALRLSVDVARTINEATTFEDAMDRVLRRLCHTQRWQTGFVYLPQPGPPETIAPVVSCCVDERLRPFHDLSMQQTYGRGDQLPGRVYSENAPLWAENREALLTALPMRAAAATAAGLCAAVAVPVAVRGEVVAILELFSDQVHPADDELRALMQSVSDQIGRIVEREQATARMADVVWREQQELLHTLHDSLGQTLTGLGMLSTGLRQRLPADAEAGETALEIARQTQHALDQVRQLAKKLFPVEVDAESLMAALRDLASATESLHKIAVRVHGQAPEALHDGKIATELYRIAQEAVTNCVKHARAKTITIAVEAVRELTVLTIADDGIGIPHPVPDEGTGLRIMRYRATSIGASFSVERRVTAGTVVTCTIRLPLMARKEPA